MMNNHFRCMALRGLSLFTAAAPLTARAASQAAAPAASESTAHEAVTFMAPYLNVETFTDKDAAKVFFASFETLSRANAAWNETEPQHVEG